VGMRARARRVGGALRVASRPGRGTTIAARIPLPTEGEPAGPDAAGRPTRAEGAS